MSRNKWVNGAIPALLLHLSVGSVYAWSLFVNKLAEEMNLSTNKIQFAFSLAIFFLGMSAAFGGKLVEKNIHKSASIGTCCFIGGLLITSVGVKIKSLLLLYLGYGVIGGIGLGITYLTPCKTLMLWFCKNKGLAMGLSVMGFGFASTIASPIITYLMNNSPVYMTFFWLAIIYIIPMLLGKLLLYKPIEFELADMNQETKFDYSTIIRNPVFILFWILFYLNIHCGLALIGVAAPILTSYNINTSAIAIIVSIMGIFNGAGRLVYSTISDYLKQRIIIYVIIFILSIISIFLGLIIPSIITLGIMLFMISSLYGAGFSNIAPLLVDYFGMDNISKIHGCILTAWAIAGLTGNTMTTFIYNTSHNYKIVFVFLIVLYAIALNCTFIIKNKITK